MTAAPLASARDRCAGAGSAGPQPGPTARHGHRTRRQPAPQLRLARLMHRALLMHVALPLLALLAAAAQAEVVTLPATGPADIAISAHWLPAPGATAPRPTIVALHGCGGLYRRDGKTLEQRYPDYVARFHAAGYHVLLPDSFGARGARSICTVANAGRSITVEVRRADALAAVRWAAAQPQVDRSRIVLLGWSHGAMTTLTALNAAQPPAVAPLAAAVVFYPGCRALLRHDFRIDTPLLMLLGERDDWTPPEPCLQLAERTRQQHPAVDWDLRVYPDSYHGFDSTGPLRWRADVPNGASRNGVHAGGNPAARAAALAELDRFLARTLQ